MGMAADAPVQVGKAERHKQTSIKSPSLPKPLYGEQ